MEGNEFFEIRAAKHKLGNARTYREAVSTGF